MCNSKSQVHWKDSSPDPYGSTHQSVVELLFKQGKWKDSSSKPAKQFHSRGARVNSWEGGNESVLLLQDYNVGHSLQVFHTIHFLQQLLKQTGQSEKGVSLKNIIMFKLKCKAKRAWNIYHHDLLYIFCVLAGAKKWFHKQEKCIFLWNCILCIFLYTKLDMKFDSRSF